MVTRILTSIDDSGLLGSPATCTPGTDCDSFLYEAVATSDAHEKLALRIATESVMLLKNDGGALPLEAPAPVDQDGTSAPYPPRADSTTCRGLWL